MWPSRNKKKKKKPCGPEKKNKKQAKKKKEKKAPWPTAEKREEAAQFFSSPKTSLRTPASTRACARIVLFFRIQMADLTRPEFDILDSEGLEYHRWVSDVETAFVAKDYTATIKTPTDPKDDGPSDKVKANALMFLRRHIDPSLRWEHLQLKTPKELWDALKGRFGNIHDTLLPELTVPWNEIRLLDYKRVNDFNKDMLRLKARLNFYGKELTEDDMIQKTLSTFPTSALILANQYRLEYDNKRITTFNKLINLLQVAERHNEVLLNNNVRPTGTKKIHEANYGKVKGGKNPNTKGVGRVYPYPRGNNAPRGKGRGGRDMGHGGPPNVWRRDGGAGPSGHGNKV
ncbi:uncharacterized protein LOC133719768 [Rosa rugosa]|uniref:uncharacterized protein LOC133719768 n=1 Tax=Rosa rugosa TaxID=74645 RepID=UPI002B4077BA|nr:uncharacterized protein LOC133719768 [Rosa rugosa]